MDKKKFVDEMVDGTDKILQAKDPQIKSIIFSKPEVTRSKSGAFTTLKYNIDVKAKKATHWVLRKKGSKKRTALCGRKTSGESGNPWFICSACSKIMGKMIKKREDEKKKELIALMKQAGQNVAIAAMIEYLHNETPGLTVTNDIPNKKIG